MLKDHSKTIWTFHQMVFSNELPTSVIAQYILGINCTDKGQIEIVVRGGIRQYVVNLDNVYDDKRNYFEAWEHHNHMTDNRQ